MQQDWIDISIPLADGMIHWPGDVTPEVRLASAMERGDVCNISVLNFSAHVGTHMDAPLHFISGGRPIDTMPLEATVGPALVVESHGEQRVEPADLEAHDIRPGARLLLKTRNSRRRWWTEPFDESFVALSPAAARWLAERQVVCVGVDYLSFGKFGDEGIETHHVLLGAGIWAIEGLNLTEVEPGLYDLICLPLKLQGAEGAPARAILRRSPAQ